MNRGSHAKLVDRIVPVLEPFSLTFLGGMLPWLAMSGRYVSFVPSSARLGIIASSIGLFACALTLSAHTDADEHKSMDTATSCQAMTRDLVAPLAAVLLILLFRVSPPELAAGVIDARPTSGGPTIDTNIDDSTKDTPGVSNDVANGDTSPASGSDSQNADVRQVSSSEELELMTDNFYSQVEETIANRCAHDGQRIELTGFVLSAETTGVQASIPCATDEESSAVVRMATWRYAADMHPVGFAVRQAGSAPTVDSWVHVNGTPCVHGGKALVINTDSVTLAQTPSPEFAVQTH